MAALVPHHACEPWLDTCLEALCQQTRPLHGIIVIDDASPEPPIDIVRRYPAVTLLASTENVGPYRLLQQVIDSTGYDAYLFQDADDWSLPGRLAALMTTAEQTGAELIGCQGYRLLTREAEVVPFTYPLDVNAVLRDQPASFPLLHPTSLMARDLNQRIGGFSTGLRFGGDAEFLHRACHAATLVNSPEFAYVKRIREGALTSDAATGLQSAARLELHRIRDARALTNAALVAAGQPPDLRPLTVAGPVPLQYLHGPPVRGAGGTTWPS